jgi:hypothetical protein
MSLSRGIARVGNNGEGTRAHDSGYMLCDGVLACTLVNDLQGARVKNPWRFLPHTAETV